MLCVYVWEGETVLYMELCMYESACSFETQLPAFKLTFIHFASIARSCSYTFWCYGCRVCVFVYWYVFGFKCMFTIVNIWIFVLYARMITMMAISQPHNLSIPHSLPFPWWCVSRDGGGSGHTLYSHTFVFIYCGVCVYVCGVFIYACDYCAVFIMGCVYVFCFVFLYRGAYRS